jgi:hypothetical protein
MLRLPIPVRTARSRSVPAALLSLPLLFAATALLAADPDADVPVVHSTAPLLPPRIIQLEEEWRLGGEDGLMFGLMIDAVCDEEGNVYLMDQQLSTVTVVSPAGEVLRTLFREGEGPGETSTPHGIALLPDGTVALAEQFPGKLVRVDRDNNPAPSITLVGGKEANVGFTMMAGCSYRAGTLIAAGMYQVPSQGKQSRVSYLAKIDPETGEELLRYRVHETVLDFQKAHLVEREMIAPCYTHAIGPDARLYCARDWREYAVEVLSPEGRLERVITREFKGLERDKMELDRINALFEVQARNLNFPITWEVEPYAQTVAGLRVDEAGNLWVSHSLSEHDQPEGIMTSYDVFGPDGRWREVVQVESDADPRYDGLIWLDDGRVLLVKGLVLAQLTGTGSEGAVFDEEEGTGEMEVICCRVRG